jgi:hypothetical protein
MLVRERQAFQISKAFNVLGPAPCTFKLIFVIRAIAISVGHGPFQTLLLNICNLFTGYI